MDSHPEQNYLLESLHPQLRPGAFVFCTVDSDQYRRLLLEPLALFRETEGITLILDQETAGRSGLSYDHLWSWIELTVPSSLIAVGLLAAVSRRLAAAGISLNVVSAYHHDHLFVLRQDAERAVALLSQGTR